MKQTGIYNCWYYFRKGKVGGQMATLLTLVMAVIFLFVAVTLNIGRVAQKKTITTNAADGAAMKMASYLGSYANKLSLEVLGGGLSECKRNFSGFFKLVCIAIAIITHQYWLVIAVLAASYCYDYVHMDAGSINHIMEKISENLRLEDQVAEGGIFYAFTNCVDDPTMVVDEHDYNRDGDRTDEISQFTEWYMEERASEWINNETESTRRDKIADFIPKVEDFANEVDSFRQSFTEDETRALALECLDPPDCPDCTDDCIEWGVVATAGIDGEFVTLLEELKAVFEEAAVDFPVTFWIEDADIFDPDDSDYNLDEVDLLSYDLYDFYLFALDEDEAGFCLWGLDTLVQMYDLWMPMFYTEGPPDPEDPERVWYKAWQEHQVKIDGWYPELNTVNSRLDDMIDEPQDEIDAKQDEIDDVIDEIARVIAMINDPDTPPEEIPGLEERLAELQALLLVLQGEMSALQGELSALEGEQGVLRDLQDRLDQAIDKLIDFQNALISFNQEIRTFYLNTIDDELGYYFYEPWDTYSWHDSAGWHHVRVEVPTEIKLPYINVTTERKWYGKKVCVSVERASGDVKVLVDRYDQSSDHFFLAGGRHRWWRFRYVQDGGAEDAAGFDPENPVQALPLGVHTESVGHYTHDALPTIRSVR